MKYIIKKEAIENATLSEWQNWAKSVDYIEMDEESTWTKWDPYGDNTDDNLGYMVNNEFFVIKNDLIPYRENKLNLL
jgi:hypothetical protein